MRQALYTLDYLDILDTLGNLGNLDLDTLDNLDDLDTQTPPNGSYQRDGDELKLHNVTTRSAENNRCIGIYSINFTSAND